jgi:hypothetical protein
VAWVPLAALIAATGIGTGLGLAGQPGATADGSLFLQQVLKTTEGAGSARFTFTSVTTSQNRLLRSSSRGSGVVSFRTRSGEATTRSRSASQSISGSSPNAVTTQTSTVNQVQLGRTLYVEFEDFGPPGGGWLIERHLPDFLGGAMDLPGLNDLASAADPGPSLTLTVSTIGPRLLGSTMTVEYSVVTSSTCPTPRVRGGSGRVTVGPTRVWIDDHGRLARLQTSLTETIPAPAPRGLPALLSGSITTVESLQMEAYGVPVDVRAPTPLAPATSKLLTFGAPQVCP